MKSKLRSKRREIDKRENRKRVINRSFDLKLSSYTPRYDSFDSKTLKIQQKPMNKDIDTLLQAFYKKKYTNLNKKRDAYNTLMEYKNFSSCVLKEKKEIFLEKINNNNNPLDTSDMDRRAQSLDKKNLELDRGLLNTESYKKAGDIIRKKIL